MFVTNCISTTKIQKISEITNFFRHYFLSRTEVYIGAGAIIIGGITVGNNVSIGAGAIVVEDVPSNTTIVSQKARIILHS